MILRRTLMVVVPIGVLALGAFAAITMIQNRPQPEQKPAEVPVPLIRVIEVKSESLRLKVHAEGTVAPKTVSELVPEVSGRAIWVSPDLATGGFFEEGEVLLKIDTRDYELAMIQARSSIAQAKLRVATEEQEGTVASKEWESLGKGEPSPLVLRKPQIAEAEAQLASAEAALAQAEYDIERTVVKAPFAGRVRSEQVDVGQFVQRGTSVASLYSVDYAEVRLPIADGQLAYVNLPLAYRDAENDQKGPDVILRAQFAGNDHEWRGRIVRTEGEIDAKSRMVHAVAQVADPYGAGKNPGRPPLAVGMFVQAEIQGKSVSNVVRLPRSVLRGEDHVLVVDDENRLYFRQIDILRADQDHVLVRSGLKAGEHVCLSAVEAAVNGMKVQLVDEEDNSEAAVKARPQS